MTKDAIADRVDGQIRGINDHGVLSWLQWSDAATSVALVAFTDVSQNIR